MKTSMSKERVGRMWILTWAATLAAVMAQTPETCLGAPYNPRITLKATVASYSSVTLTWNDIIDNGYRVYVNGSPWGSSLRPNTTSQTVTGLSPYTTYTFQVRSIGLSRVMPSVSSNIVSATTPGAPPALTLAKAPTSLDTEFELKVTFDWNLGSSDDRYELQFTEPSQTIFPPPDQNVLVYYISDGNPRSPRTLCLAPEACELGQTIRYRVRARGGEFVSAWSNTVPVTFPTLNATALTCNEVLLEWPNALDENEWWIYEWNGSEWVLLARMYGDGSRTAGPLRARVVNCAPSYQHCFGVAAFSEDFTLLWSAQVCATTPACSNLPTCPGLMINAEGMWTGWEPYYGNTHTLVINENGYVQRYVEDQLQASGTGWIEDNSVCYIGGFLYAFDVNDVHYIMSTLDWTISFWLPDSNYTRGMVLQKQ